MNAQKTPRKVVSIPVHFVASAPPTATSAASTSATSTSAKAMSATMIQKVFRGFLVRKNLKKVVSIKKEVDEAEKRVLATLENIRKDPKERLKMNETLMGLLFKLDSVQGVGHGVRECRKAVIKKAIVLQEIIDGCDVSRNANQDLEIIDGCDGVYGGIDDSNADVENRAMEIEGTESNHNDGISKNSNQDDFMEISDQGLEIEDGLEKVVVLDEKIDTFDESSAYVSDRAMEIEGKVFGVGDKYDDKSNENINQDLEEDMVENEDDYLPKSVKCEKFVEPEMEEDEEDYCMVKKVIVGEGDDYETKPMGNQVEKDCYNGDEDKSENCKNREILEKMMEENVKMMSMMKQLCEQHQAQTQMLSLLSHRVEQLEKSFVREISRKKPKDKKKKAANGVTNGLDFCPGGKKR